MQQNLSRSSVIQFDTVQRLVDKLDQISIDVAEIKVKLDGLIDQNLTLGTDLRDSETQIQRLKSSLTSLKAIGATLAALWGVAITLIGLYVRLK